MKYIIALCVLISAPLFGMDQPSKREWFSNRLIGETTETAPKGYPATDSIASKFYLTSKEQLQFFHAIEDKENISSYLQDEAIIGNWRILAVGQEIAKKAGNELAREKIVKILKAKYNIE